MKKSFLLFTKSYLSSSKTTRNRCEHNLTQLFLFIWSAKRSFCLKSEFLRKKSSISFHKSSLKIFQTRSNWNKCNVSSVMIKTKTKNNSLNNKLKIWFIMKITLTKLLSSLWASLAKIRLKKSQYFTPLEIWLAGSQRQTCFSVTLRRKFQGFLWTSTVLWTSATLR